jgi:hypothetical protein
MTAIHIAYETTDEVNLESATQVAQEYGASLSRFPDPAAGPGGSLVATLLDLDHMDAQRGRAIVGELLSRPVSYPVAVHGFDLGDEEMSVLHANGVAVSRPFRPELVRALCRALESPGVTVPDPENGHAHDAPDDPAVICGMVRSLATDVSRAIHRRPEGTPNVVGQEIDDLRGRIDDLQRHLARFRHEHNLLLRDLQRWVESLRRYVEGLVRRPPREARGPERGPG